MKFFFTLLFTSAIVSSVMAADIYVREFGGGGAYPTISEAIAAANAGDRILVVPKSGNAPYIENLTINKELQLLSAINGEHFQLQGHISFSINLPAGSHVVIDGVTITTGVIQANNSTNPIAVSIVNCNITSGYISLGNNINATIANNTVSAIDSYVSSIPVTFSRGKCLGNRLTARYGGITVNNGIVTSLDTVYIVGNHITHPQSAEVEGGILWDNNTQFFYIANNYIYSEGPYISSSQQNLRVSLIKINKIKSGTNTNEFNNIINNTLRFSVSTSANTNNYFYGIFINPTSINNRNNIFNNLIIYPANQPNSSRAAVRISGNAEISYNVACGIIGGLSAFNSVGATVNSTNQMSNPTIYTVDTGGCVSSSGQIDNGHPDPIFTDLDLTRNDVGACGGSYNITTNFRTNGTAGSAKVHWLEAPRRVLQGGTVAIKAEGHDR